MNERHATCLIVDDHPMVRRAVRLQLRSLPWLEVVGEACDGVEGLEALHALRPDVAIVDVRMPRMDGIRMTREATDAGLPTRIVIHSAFAAPAVVHQARDAGAVDCSSKSSSPTALAEAVTRAVAAHVSAA